VPMNTFRRTRSAILPESPVSNMSMSLPQHGFSYGATFGSVLRSTSSTAWWDTGSPGTKGKRGATPRGSQSLALALSPVIFPVRDGDRTPPSNSNGRHHSHHNFSPSSQHKVHKDKERRRKKSKTVDSASVKPVRRPSHIQRVSSLVAVPSLRL